MRGFCWIFPGALVLAALSALVAAQGDKHADRAKKNREEFRQEATAGPGHVQARFLVHLEGGLTEHFTDRRSTAMLTLLRRHGLEPADVMRLMNGNATRASLQKMLGVNRREAARARRALDEAVDRKNRRLFFGVLAFVMIGEFNVDPTSPFLKQVLHARDELTADQFRSLRVGSHRTERRMLECFDLRSEEDQKFMLKVLERVRDSFYMNHPYCESLGCGRARDYDPDKFPKLADGMPGSEQEYEKGEAGGLPFDRELPPLPFVGERVDKLLDR